MTERLAGVTFLEHTADVGLDVTAPSPESLFHRAALGMLALLQGREDEGPEPEAAPTSSGPGSEALSIELEADGRPELLRVWLRELLLLHETRHRDYVRAQFGELTATRLEARVETAPSAPAVREIKGVTYHELAVDDTETGWKARVIFDV